MPSDHKQLLYMLHQGKIMKNRHTKDNVLYYKDNKFIVQTNTKEYSYSTLGQAANHMNANEYNLQDWYEK